MNSSLDRENLRLLLRSWSDHQRRIALERVIEQVPDATLETLLHGLVHLGPHRLPAEARAPSLRERIDALAAATRRGDYLGQYELRNAHGQREPWQTAAWLAATSHLFELALLQLHADATEASLFCLQTLTTLVAEVDERVDELVVFEDSSASQAFSQEVQQAKRLLNSAPP